MLPKQIVAGSSPVSRSTENARNSVNTSEKPRFSRNTPFLPVNPVYALLLPNFPDNLDNSDTFRTLFGHLSSRMRIDRFQSKHPDRALVAGISDIHFQQEEKMQSYCTQNEGDCGTCSLSNYGRDCQNNTIDRLGGIEAKLRAAGAQTSNDMINALEDGELLARLGITDTDAVEELHARYTAAGRIEQLIYRAADEIDKQPIEAETLVLRETINELVELVEQHRK